MAQKIHTTIGVYNNDQYVMNGVLPEYLEAHIEYNIENRGGRALFVDGICVHRGYLDYDRVQAWEMKIKNQQLVTTTLSKTYS